MSDPTPITLFVAKMRARAEFLDEMEDYETAIVLRTAAKLIERLVDTAGFSADSRIDLEWINELMKFKRL